MARYPWWFWLELGCVASSRQGEGRGRGCLFVRRRKQSQVPEPAASPAVRFDPGGDGPVNVRDLLERYSIEELSEGAEGYFARLTSWDAALAKPFYSLYEAPDLMVGVGALLSGLELVHGLSVLDFGAGTGWLSWMLTQLGCRAVLTDVSGTALRIAAERYRRWPIIGAGHEPAFLPFDGYRIDLDDASVDRVACNDAFHHVGNPEQVLAEFARVLVPGGICVMVEPGPNHSRGPQAQAEMRHFRVIERDIVVGEIAAQARAGGFESVDVGVFAGLPRFVDVDSFPSATGPESTVPGDITREFLENRRLLRLRKAGAAVIDSRDRTALAGRLEVTVTDGRVHAQIHNTGRARWLQGDEIAGQVNLGAHLYGPSGQLVEFDFLRLRLQTGKESIPPGASVEVAAELAPLPPGDHTLEFDLVSEEVAWFADNGNATVTIHP